MHGRNRDLATARLPWEPYAQHSKMPGDRLGQTRERRAGHPGGHIKALHLSEQTIERDIRLGKQAIYVRGPILVGARGLSRVILIRGGVGLLRLLIGGSLTVKVVPAERRGVRTSESAQVPASSSHSSPARSRI